MCQVDTAQQSPTAGSLRKARHLSVLSVLLNKSRPTENGPPRGLRLRAALPLGVLSKTNLAAEIFQESQQHESSAVSAGDAKRISYKVSSTWAHINDIPLQQTSSRSTVTRKLEDRPTHVGRTLSNIKTPFTNHTTPQSRDEQKGFLKPGSAH